MWLGYEEECYFANAPGDFFVSCVEDNYNSTAANASTEQVARVGNRTYYLSLPPLYSPSLIHTAVLAKCLLLACVLKENFREKILIHKYQTMKQKKTL